MEIHKVTAYRFSYSLFAYLYKKIGSEIKLPLNTDYIVPTTSLFSYEIGDCVLKVRAIFKPFLERVISNHFSNISSEEILFDCSKWYGETLISLESFTFLKLITLCSFLMELVVYNFDKECYYFAPSAPTCLSEILRSSEVFSHFSPLIDFFTELKCFSSEILQNTNSYSNNLPSILAQEAKYIENNFMSLFPNNIPENSSDTSLIVSRCVLEKKEPVCESDDYSKSEGCQTVNIENFCSTSKDFSKSIGFQHDKLTLATEQIKRKSPTCDSENGKKSKEIKVPTPTFQLSRVNISPSIPFMLPLCLQSYPELSAKINDSSVESYQQVNEFDFSACFEPFDNDYNNVDEFNPSYSFESKFDLTYLNKSNSNSSENKLSNFNSIAKLCPSCNCCCIDVLSDFINDIKETNYESD